MPKDSRRQLLKFALIGGLGFVVDGGVLTLLSVVAGFNVYLARLNSFGLATLATWWLNRQHTFATGAADGVGAKASEYARYILVQVGGGLLNLSIFAWLIFIDPGLSLMPVVPLAIGALAGLIWNFLGARLWVYRAGG